MSAPSEYLGAVIPEAVRVFGILLRPFSIGHQVILSRFNSPIVTGGEAGIEDLLFAVYVCGNTYEGCLESIATGRIFADLKRWRRVMRRRQWYGLRPLTLPRFMLASQLFREYIDAANTLPNLFTDGKGQSIGSPPIQVLRVTLMRELHLSDTEVMNRPLSLCWYDYSTIVELEGKGKIIERAEYQAAEAKADEFERRMQPTAGRN